MFDNIAFYSNDELENMKKIWDKYYDAIDADKEVYVPYPKDVFSYDEIIREQTKRKNCKEEAESWTK